MLSIRRSLRLATVVLPAFILAGCFWQTEPSFRYDYYTRITEVSSKSYQKVTNPLIRLEMNAKWISNQGYVIDTSVSSLNANDLDLGLVWTDERHYSYVTRDKINLYCTIGCTAIEKGRIYIPAEEFEEFAETGFTFKLVGRGHFINGYLSPEAFQEVLDQMKNLPPEVRPITPKKIKDKTKKQVKEKGAKPIAKNNTANKKAVKATAAPKTQNSNRQVPKTQNSTPTTTNENTPNQAETTPATAKSVTAPLYVPSPMAEPSVPIIPVQ